MHDDPFAVPENVAPTPAWARVDPGALHAADPGSRFAARVVDNLALMATFLPSVFTSAMLGAPNPDSEPLLAVLAFVPTAVAAPALVGWQWYRLSTDGTTLGKRLADIRVVSVTGAPPGFVAGVMVREWGKFLIQLGFGGIGTLLAIVDALTVFSAQGRTIHDWFAGTRVVRGAAPSEADFVLGEGDGEEEMHPEL